MPIRELRDSDLDQQCANCGAVAAIGVDDLAVGVAHDTQLNPALVGLPPCAACGSTEFLIRSPDGEEHPAPGSFGHKHKLLVDKLHARLVQRGQVALGLDAAKVTTKEPPEAVMDRWFKDGLKLPLPPKNDGDAQ
jgi:hypothetical protein